MYGKDRFIAFLQWRPWIPFVLIFVIFLLAHLFIFRDVVAQIPAIIAGNAVLAREELVPFFSSSQYWPQDTSALSGSDEIRVAYSFWTSWVRHYAVLPFALVLLNAISAFMLFYAFYHIGRYMYKDRRLMVIFVAFLATIPIHFILLYAKITHFYTLIFGFSMMALALSVMLEQLFFRQKLSWRNVIVVSLLALFNPAIHYHVIFYMVLGLATIIHLVTTTIYQRAKLKLQAKKDIAYVLLVILLSLVPYALFLLLMTSATSAAASIPVNYDMIRHTSVLFTALLAFDIAAQVDMFRYGAYLVAIPRATMMVLTVLILSLFFFKRWRYAILQHKIFLVSLFTLLVISAWMSLGYSNPMSFHSVLAPLVVFLAQQANIVADMLGQGIGIFINILRFPHRFEFVYFYVGGILLMVALLWLIDWLRTKKIGQRVAIPLVIAAAIVVAPMVLTRDYYPVLMSGDFDGFLRPYPLNEDIKKVREKLAATDNSKMFVLPTLESGRELPSESGLGRYNFIDKFFIYYFDQKTEYYGLGGTMDQKIRSFLVYRAIHEGEPWWQDVLIDNMGITHIFHPKQTKARPVGLTYMPEVDAKIARALEESDRFEAVYDGEEYALYQAKAQPDIEHGPTLVNMQWHNLQEYMAQRPTHERLYFPEQLDQEDMPEQFNLRTDDEERSFYDLYLTNHDESTYTPDSYVAPFVGDVAPSSYFMTQTLSMFTLDDPNDKYNRVREHVPTLTNLLHPQFVATHEDGGLVRIGFSVEDGEERLLLRAASHSDTLNVTIDDETVTFEKIGNEQTESDEGSLDFTYFSVETELEAGTYAAILEDVPESVVVESLSVMPKKDIPDDFADVDMPGLTIESSSNESYNVWLRKNPSTISSPAPKPPASGQDSPLVRQRSNSYASSSKTNPDSKSDNFGLGKRLWMGSKESDDE